MPEGPELELQRSLIARCRSASSITDLVSSRTYDEPPQSVVRPFVRIGTIEVNPLRTDDRLSWEITFGIEAYSRPNQGRVEATRVARAIINTFDEQETALALSGFKADWIFFVTSAVSREADGKSYVATVAFDAVVTAV